MAIAGRMMRRVLVDYSRGRKALKRNQGLRAVTLTDALPAETSTEVDLLALDECLNALERQDPRQARIVELRYFAGLSIEETAHTMKISPVTVKREWAMARAWLRRQLRLVEAGSEAGQIQSPIERGGQLSDSARPASSRNRKS
jgi:RNA polymerase sigma factor (TIGR02999 family)